MQLFHTHSHAVVMVFRSGELIDFFIVLFKVEELRLLFAGRSAGCFGGFVLSASGCAGAAAFDDEFVFIIVIAVHGSGAAVVVGGVLVVFGLLLVLVSVLVLALALALALVLALSLAGAVGGPLRLRGTHALLF